MKNPSSSEHKGETRVRFAPSPTGYLHLGGLRTALFNYLYAKACGGKCILRIEDTDQSRLVEGAVENLLEAFRWLGIGFDEGPGLGGGYGPYTQSERLVIYREHAERLLEEGSAYYCFCSAGRLEKLRREQASRGETPMYDRLCRDIPLNEAKTRAENEPHVVRLKMPLEGSISFEDGVRGEIRFEAAETDDQVLLKSDGYPTYHLANVVDDHLMRITDVIRGEEWLTSTPKHIHLYQVFGWSPPRFHHLPLLLNPDRSKLSKRQGDVAVEDYRAKGYLPEALLNYTSLLGWRPDGDREFFTLGELEREFELNRVGKSGAVFDLEKLNWLNKRHLAELSDEEFFECAAGFLPENIDIAPEVRDRVLTAVRERSTTFVDAAREIEPFQGRRELPLEGEGWEWLRTEDSRVLLTALHDSVEGSGEWTDEVFKNLLKTAGKTAGLKGKALWIPVRVALTGKLHGPDLGLMAETLGRERCREFLREALDKAV